MTVTSGTTKTETAQSTFLCFVLAICIIGSFTIFGYAQEALTRGTYDGERFTYPTALIVIQAFCNVVCSSIVLFITKPENKFSAGAKPQDWLIVSSAYLGAHECGYLALSYIPFPLQVVCKSCKAVPVLIGETVIAKKSHSLSKKLQVLLMVIGVVVFTLSGSPKKGGHDDWSLTPAFCTGLVLVFGALVCDGIYGPYQNTIIQKYGANNFQLMFNMNLYELVLALVLCGITGELSGALAFIIKHPDILQPLAYFGITITIGSVFIFTMQERYHALAVTLTTTLRKLVSVVFSVFWFGHTLTRNQWSAAILVFLAQPIAQYTCQLVGIEKKTDKRN